MKSAVFELLGLADLPRCKLGEYGSLIVIAVNTCCGILT